MKSNWFMIPIMPPQTLIDYWCWYSTLRYHYELWIDQ